MKNINQLIAEAEKAGFEEYGSFKEEGSQHIVLTCTKGGYNGEVIDIYYDYDNGTVHKIEHSTQFIGQDPKFNFI